MYEIDINLNFRNVKIEKFDIVESNVMNFNAKFRSRIIDKYTHKTSGPYYIDCNSYLKLVKKVRNSRFYYRL